MEVREEDQAVALADHITEDREVRRHLRRHTDTEDMDTIGHMDAASCRFVYLAE